MFQDRKQELERLSQELLEENDWEEETENPEDWDEELDEDEYEDFDEDGDWDEDFDDPDYPEVVNVRAYNTDHADRDLDEMSDEVYYAPKSRLTGLLIAAGICAMVVFLLLVYLVLRHNGIV